MATASDDPGSAIKAMENELSCCICFNLLRVPKDLDCPHVYCLQCLQEWVGEEPTIECPECRHITIVPSGGLGNLKSNLRLKNMVEMYITRIGKQKDVPICQNHEGERQHFFCVTCGVTVCRDCLVLEHERPHHEIKELKVITKTRKTEMKAKLNQVHAEEKKVEDDEKKIDAIQRQMQASKEIAQSKVKKRVRCIIEEAEAKGRETTDRIEKMYDERMKTVREEKNRTKERGKRLKNVCSAAQTVVDTAADHVYMKQHASLVGKMDKLCVAQHEIPKSDMACLHFDPGSDPVDTALLGKLSKNHHTELKLTLIAEFGEFEKAQGIAVTQKGLLAVVDAKSKEVVVYGNDNGEYKRQFCLGVPSDNPNAKLINPFDIAVTSDDKFLVIDDGKTVKFFSETGKYEKKFSIQGSRITTARDDTKVIGNTARQSITIYNSNGNLLKTHQIGAGHIEDIATNSKQIAFTRGSEGTLCVIDMESGQGLWTFDLDWPFGICFEEKSNSILVAGNSKTQGKHVIEQYCNTTGKFVSRLASGLYNPFTMTITHDGKLAVADLKTVKVYSIQ